MSKWQSARILALALATMASGTAVQPSYAGGGSATSCHDPHGLFRFDGSSLYFREQADSKERALVSRVVSRHTIAEEEVDCLTKDGNNFGSHSRVSIVTLEFQSPYKWDDKKLTRSTLICNFASDGYPSGPADTRCVKKTTKTKALDDIKLSTDVKIETTKILDVKP